MCIDMDFSIILRIVAPCPACGHEQQRPLHRRGTGAVSRGECRIFSGLQKLNDSGNLSARHNLKKLVGEGRGEANTAGGRNKKTKIPPAFLFFWFHKNAVGMPAFLFLPLSPQGQRQCRLVSGTPTHNHQSNKCL